MFYQYILDYPDDIFNQLVKSIEFENITKGRKAANIIKYQDNLIPLVRTTTKYNKPVQQFLPIHQDLIKKIKNISDIPYIDFNNGLVEIYTNEYRTMGYHSDQALDLELNSFICIYSCYTNPSKYDCRSLVVKNKLSGIITNINLIHNSVVVFSTQTNSQHLHKIILETNSYQDTKWLGITLRLGKTFIKFIDELPYFYKTNRILRLCVSKEEQKEFYKLRSLENQNMDFSYPQLDITISPSDLVDIKNIYQM